jgi:hypothetical protein
MLSDDFRKQRAKTVRAMAEAADPFIKQRLLDLASRYESGSKTPAPLTATDLQFESRGTGSERG